MLGKTDIGKERPINRFVALSYQIEKDHRIKFKDVVDDFVDKELVDIISERIVLFDNYVRMYYKHLGSFFNEFINNFYKTCDKPHMVYELAGLYLQAVGTIIYAETSTPEDLIHLFYTRVHLNLSDQGEIVYKMLLQELLTHKSYEEDIAEEVGDFYEELMKLYDELGRDKPSLDEWIHEGARAFLRRCGTTREDLIDEIFNLAKTEYLTQEMLDEVFEYHGHLENAPDEFPSISFPEGLDGPAVRTKIKVYPNDPCPCGSGKKYKKCCGRDYGIKDKDENNSVRTLDCD